MNFTIQELKNDIKTWERMFVRQYGRKPSKADIKSAGPEIQQCYKQYGEMKKKSLELSGNDIFAADLNKPKICEGEEPKKFVPIIPNLRKDSVSTEVTTPEDTKCTQKSFKDELKSLESLLCQELKENMPHETVSKKLNTSAQEEYKENMPNFPVLCRSKSHPSFYLQKKFVLPSNDAISDSDSTCVHDESKEVTSEQERRKATENYKQSYQDISTSQTVEKKVDKIDEVAVLASYSDLEINNQLLQAPLHQVLFIIFCTCSTTRNSNMSVHKRGCV